MLVPSIIVSVVIFALIAMFSVQKGSFSFSSFFSYALSSNPADFLLRSIPLLLISVVLSLVFAFIFSLPSHATTGDMWFSLLHGIFVSMPIFLLLFLLMFVFSDILKLLPSKGIFDLKTFIMPSISVSMIFALYISFKIRYLKKTVNIIQVNSNVKKTFFYSLKTFSSETGIFLTILFVTEFFFYSGGIGYGIGISVNAKNIIDICVIFLYASLIFILLRYIFYLLAFLVLGKQERAA